MYSALLKIKWPLLAFLVITLAGVQLFIGEGSGLSPTEPGQLAPPSVTEQVTTAPEPEEIVEEEPDLEGFYSGGDSEEAYVDDEELIDSAEGFDPTPAAEDEELADEDAEEDVVPEDLDDGSGELIP